MEGKLYQYNLGKPFYLKNIDRLFYVCCFTDCRKSFLMDKEKFDLLVNRGQITEYRLASNY